ncbi:hypothetical protein KEM55_000185 [Ascosphaera atra]|nr:hypothetical protein KEM55_000185 [Ascosphaera atra]
MPMLTLTESELDPSQHGSNDPDVAHPSDPDPFLSVSFDKERTRSRRSSLVPLSEQQRDQENAQDKPVKRRLSYSDPPIFRQDIFSSRPQKSAKSAKSRSRLDNKGILDDTVLVKMFQYLDIYQLLRLRAVSHHWRHLLMTSPGLVEVLDLSEYGRKVTDDVLVNIICPFVGERPRIVDMNNCFHVTDVGFLAVIGACGVGLRCIRMKSVWDVSAWTILEMANRAKNLTEIDLSNCRKVGDTLLARIMGWFVKWDQMTPQHKQQVQQQASQPLTNGPIALQNIKGKKSVVQTPILTQGGCAYGCPQLKKITLSYCKHVGDRTMYHIAHHAAPRIEEINLTRCTYITDLGFQSWSSTSFPRLRRLVLADCTYLTDAAIICLTKAAPHLKELDLSFCCSLSDTALEVIALGCPQLVYLNVAFCGSAVSDQSLQSLGLHLHHLKGLSVRGCVRVTGLGVDFVASSCEQLVEFDVSQCKNLIPWLIERGHCRYGGRVKFLTVSPDYPRHPRRWS